MSINKIEALVDAVAHLKGASTNPDSDLYQIRNPIGTMSFSRPGKNEIDADGRRVFKTWMAGYRAAAFDLTIKCSGTSRAGLKKEDKLENLLGTLGIKELGGQQQVVKFLKIALKDQSISRTTLLSYFVEN
jgi:hypothetical protein